MLEGVLLLNDGKLAVRYFQKGDVVYRPLAVGETVEIFQNGYWAKLTVDSIDKEPYFSAWNYGDCLGCEVRLY